MKNRIQLFVKRIKSDSLNLFLAGMCLFPILLFSWRLVGGQLPLLFIFLDSVAVLSAFLGILLYYNKYSVWGIIFQILNISLFVLSRHIYNKDIFGNLYVWIFSALLIFFIGHSIYKLVRSRTSNQSNWNSVFRMTFIK